MPLEQRVIQPIYVSRGCFPQDGKCEIQNELECVTNGTLANIIRQLSNLSNYAEDLFGNILTDVTVLVQRSSSIQTRLDGLVDKVQRLDSANDLSSFRDLYHNRKPYRSKADSFDQQVVSRLTIPRSLREVYALCDPPPSLQKLNPFRDDNSDGLKLYTNPNYFFELWREEMLENRSRNKAGKKHTPNNVHQNGVANQGKARRKYMRNQASVQSNDSVTQYADSPQRVAPMIASGAVQMMPQQQQQQQQQQHYPVYSENGVPLTAYQAGERTISKANMPTGSDYQHLQQYYPQHSEMIMQTKREESNPNGKGTYSVVEGSYIDPNNYQHHYKHQYNSPQQYEQQQQMMANSKQRPDSLELSKQQQQIYQDHYAMGMHAKAGQPQDYNANYQQQQRANNEQQQYAASQHMVNANNLTPTRRSALLSRPSQPPPAPPEGGGSGSSANTSGPPTPSNKMGVFNGDNDYDAHQQATRNRDYLPPPPPMPMNMSASGHDVHDGNLPPPPPMQTSNDEIINSPPPPPPPPMNLLSGNPIGNGQLSLSCDKQDHQKQSAQQNNVRSANLTAEELQSVKLKKTTPMDKPKPEFDARSNLLDAIRHGVKLKKVEESKAKENEKSAPLHDVASILARRVALEMSDDSDGENASEADDSDEWNDESEC